MTVTLEIEKEDLQKLQLFLNGDYEAAYYYVKQLYEKRVITWKTLDLFPHLTEAQKRILKGMSKDE